jgi:hypothetical protein
MSNELETKKIVWREYRNFLDSQKIDIEKTADKIIFLIASGSIGLSITFLDKITISNKWLFLILLFSWGFLVYSIFIQAKSHIIASRKILEVIDKVDDVLLSTDEDSFFKSQSVTHKNVSEKNNEIRNNTEQAFKFMIIGISFMLVFFSVVVLTSKTEQVQIKNIILDTNYFIKKSDTMSKSESNKPAPEKVKNSTRLNEEKQTFSQTGSGEAKTRENKQAVQIAKPPAITKPNENK